PPLLRPHAGSREEKAARTLREEVVGNEELSRRLSTPPLVVYPVLSARARGLAERGQPGEAAGLVVKTLENEATPLPADLPFFIDLAPSDAVFKELPGPPRPKLMGLFDARARWLLGQDRPGEAADALLRALDSAGDKPEWEGRRVQFYKMFT